VDLLARCLKPKRNSYLKKIPPPTAWGGEKAPEARVERKNEGAWTICAANLKGGCLRSTPLSCFRIARHHRDRILFAVGMAKDP